MKLSTQILLIFILIILLSVTYRYTNYIISEKGEHPSHFVTKLEEIVQTLNKTDKIIIEMQTAFKGYLPTADHKFVDSYCRGLENLPQLIKAQPLKKTLSPNKACLDFIRVLYND